MTPHYLLETGIRPWEESTPPNSSFATISIVVSALEDLLPIINKLFPAFGDRFAHWFRWHTQRHPFEGNAIQKRKLAATLSSDVGLFGTPMVKMSDGIISSISNITVPITEFELETLSDYRRELMIGTGDSAVTAEILCSLMAPHSGGCTSRGLAEMLCARDNLVFGRCFTDADTHAAFQWFGPKPELLLVDRALAGLGIKSLKSRMEVTNILKA